MAQKRLPLPADFANWPEVRALRQYGHDARRLRDLYLMILCHCWSNGTDGFVASEDIGILVYPDAPRTGEADMGRLIKAGVAERAVGGYLATAYPQRFPRQASVEAVAGKQAEGARRANHDRWHAKRKESDPGCEFCQSTDQSTEMRTDQSTDQYSDQQTDVHTDLFTDPELRNPDPAAEAELFREPPGSPKGEPSPPPCSEHPSERHGSCRACAASGRSGAADQPDPRFTEFWAVYPRKVGKPRAVKAWRAAMRRKDDPVLITKAAADYAALCASERTETRFIAHPSTWLNDERYNDDEPAGGHAEDDDDDFWSR